ncbi:flavin reductase family protein [Derxia lacustris]|uniref:flavin reductase family protein n=1 Tax=Derxia lacustris TaxID=764842 RepID=UPI000A16FE73|nr:flavin reductase family protein [Derxia lacustris]
MAVASDAYKAGMRRLAAGVTLITTPGAAGPSGLTATAVCSVSADPPILLCCVNRGSASHAALLEAGVFAVNVLSTADRPLSDRFAGRLTPAEKFAEGEWGVLETGSPVLASALAAFDCRLVQAVDAGTHAVLFGEVQAVTVADDPELHGLLYADGGYGRFATPSDDIDQGF